MVVARKVLDDGASEALVVTCAFIKYSSSQWSQPMRKSRRNDGDWLISLPVLFGFRSLRLTQLFSVERIPRVCTWTAAFVMLCLCPPAVLSINRESFERGGKSCTHQDNRRSVEGTSRVAWAQSRATTDGSVDDGGRDAGWMGSFWERHRPGKNRIGSKTKWLLAFERALWFILGLWRIWNEPSLKKLSRWCVKTNT